MGPLNKATLFCCLSLWACGPDVSEEGRESGVPSTIMASTIMDTASECETTVSPARLDFGTITVNTAASQIIEIWSSCPFEAPLEVLAIANIEACENATVAAYCFFEVPNDASGDETPGAQGAGARRLLEIRFQPTVPNAQERAALGLRYCTRASTCETDVFASGFSIGQP